MNHFRGSQKNPKVNRFSLSNECDSSARFLSSPVLPMICAAKTPTTVEKPIKRSLSKYANIKSSITGSRNAAILGQCWKCLKFQWFSCVDIATLIHDYEPENHGHMAIPWDVTDITPFLVILTTLKSREYQQVIKAHLILQGLFCSSCCNHFRQNVTKII